MVNLAGKTTLHLRLYSGAVVIIFWEPDCTPQVVIAITTSPEHSKNKS
jgi:hypothetical protein